MKGSRSKQSAIRNLRSAIGEFLGLRANVVALLAAIVFIGSGEELWIRFVPRYLEVLGAGTLVIGFYDGLKTLLGAVYAYPGGILTDRWGHRRALSFFTILSITGYLLVLAIRHKPRPGATFLFCLTSFRFRRFRSWEPVWRRKVRDGIALQSMIKRIPI
jgi:hypothetical protein